jgi:hypothetical protein
MIVDMDSEEELMHYGKKGMRWGVRREAQIQELETVAKGGASFRAKNHAGALSTKNARQQLKLNAANVSRLNRVADGTANGRDTRTAKANLPIKLIRQKGLQGAAKEVLARKEEARNLLGQVGDRKVNAYLRSPEGRAATDAALI